jgi:hypothetical protein
MKCFISLALLVLIFNTTHYLKSQSKSITQIQDSKPTEELDTVLNELKQISIENKKYREIIRIGNEK